VTLYGSETWTLRQKDVKSLETFILIYLETDGRHILEGQTHKRPSKRWRKWKKSVVYTISKRKINTEVYGHDGLCVMACGVAVMA